MGYLSRIVMYHTPIIRPMKRVLFYFLLASLTCSTSACKGEEPAANNSQTANTGNDSNGTTDDSDDDEGDTPSAPSRRTLIVYYSFTNLQSQIEADVIRVEPAEKGIDYAANNYAIGSDLIAAIRENPNDASSYPAIDPVEVNLEEYDTIIVGAPLWWSNMAAPLQTFLFNYGPQMAGKRIGLIVSSASSGISGVEADAQRLIPNGKFFSSSLWIRSSQTANCHSMIAEWLTSIGY